MRMTKKNERKKKIGECKEERVSERFSIRFEETKEKVEEKAC